MAEAKASKASEGANTATSAHGDHDRVQMLSLRADGTPDQHAPEIIGDKEVAEKAAKEQFRQQAVSAVDVEKRGVTAGPVALRGTEDGGVEELKDAPQDPSVAELEKAHEGAAKSAESAAEKAVGSLYKGA